MQRIEVDTYIDDMVLPNVLSQFDPETITYVDEFRPQDGPTQVTLHIVWDRSPSELDEILYDNHNTQSVTQCYSDDDVYLYRVGVEPLSSFAEYTVMNKLVLEHVTNAGDKHWNVSVLAPDKQILSGAIEGAKEDGMEVLMRNLTGLQERFEVGPTKPTVHLTQKQNDMLRYAFDNGFFEDPRKKTATEIGDHFDVSKVAASKRIRRSLKTVLENCYQ